MSEPEDPGQRSVLRAVAHPLRLRIMSLLTGADMSAAEVARELDLTHANASYHLRRLADAGQIQVTGTETIRGGTAKRYRYLVNDSTPAWTDPELSATERHVGFIRALTSELWRKAGYVDPEHLRPTTDLETWVDPDVWDDLTARLNAIGDELHDAARPAHSPGTVRVNLTFSAFRMLPDSVGEPASAAGSDDESGDGPDHQPAPQRRS